MMLAQPILLGIQRHRRTHTQYCGTLTGTLNPSAA